MIGTLSNCRARRGRDRVAPPSARDEEAHGEALEGVSVVLERKIASSEKSVLKLSSFLLIPVSRLLVWPSRRHDMTFTVRSQPTLLSHPEHARSRGFRASSLSNKMRLLHRRHIALYRNAIVPG